MPPRASYSPTAVLIPAVACGPFQQLASPSARPLTTGSCPASDHQPRFAADPRAGSRPAAALPGLGQLQLWNFQVISSTFSGIQCAPCPRLLFSRGSKPFPSPHAPTPLVRSVGRPWLPSRSDLRYGRPPRARDAGLLFFPRALSLRLARSRSVCRWPPQPRCPSARTLSPRARRSRCVAYSHQSLAPFVWGVSWLGLYCCHCRTLFAWTVFSSSSYISDEK